MNLVKAHAFGNDFLLLREDEAPPASDRAALARELCERRRGIGADGLIVYAEAPLPPTPRPGQAGGARMSLFNADGSFSEVSGNGVRCLAAWLATARHLRPGECVGIETDAGCKMLELQAPGTADPRRLTFRAAMGQPEHIQRRTIDVDGMPIDAVTLRVGNPQCVVLGEVTHERLHRIAAKLAVHPVFPEGSNVELAAVESPDRVRILIWERGVGPTEASGTGACAAAVAAIAYGGAARDVQVVAPGGAQRVEWTNAGIFLTGWAEVLFEASWQP